MVLQSLTGQPIKISRNAHEQPEFPFSSRCVLFFSSPTFQKRSKGYVKIAQNAKDALATRRKKKPLKT